MQFILLPILNFSFAFRHPTTAQQFIKPTPKSLLLNPHSTFRCGFIFFSENSLAIELLCQASIWCKDSSVYLLKVVVPITIILSYRDVYKVDDL